MRNDAQITGEGRSPFGRLLREFRVAANLSQESLAERAGVSSDGISVLERGARRTPHADTIALLASALELSAADRTRLQAAAAGAPVPRSRSLQSTDGGSVGRHNLPLPLTRLYGREAELQTVISAIAEQRLIALTGIGGVGKTRLALETGRAVLERFRDGVWLVELAPLSDPGLVTQRVAATLGQRARYEESGWSTASWIARLAEKQLLLILDNCEHVIDAAAAVASQLLERCPNVQVLVTTREALRIGGESVIRIDPLALPAALPGRPVTLEDLRASPAIQLFLDRARHVAPALKLPDDIAVWRMLGSVCAGLDGIPLALELAAARMNAMSLDVLARALSRRFALLTTGARTAMPRHQSLSALIDWSYELLSPAERRAFRRLSVFSGGWTLEAAQAVCADAETTADHVLTDLASLVDKSLIIADASATTLRYTMLETTHAYAFDRLTAEDERDATASWHAKYFSDLLIRHNAIWGMLPMPEWVAPLKPELDNLRAALQWSLVDGHDVILGAAIAVGQHSVLELLSLEIEGYRWCERALAALAPNPPANLEGPLQLALAKFYCREAYLERAIEAGLRAAALYRTMSAPPILHYRQNLSVRGCLVSALAFVGCAFARLRRYEEADRAASEAVALARQEPHLGILAFALIVQALAVDIASARALIDEALVLARTLPSGNYVEGLVFLHSSMVEFEAGNVAGSRQSACDAADYFRGTGIHEMFISVALAMEATCSCLSGDLDGAVTGAGEALSRGGGGVFFLMDSVQVIAHVLTRRGRPREAARLIGASEAAYAERKSQREGCVQVLYDRTITLLRESTAGPDLEAWRAEGRRLGYDANVEAALDFAYRSRPSASESYG
jgi:predicted ATPase/DNA-binding XRE family transcriptional regulator